MAELLKAYYDREWRRFQEEAKVFAQTYPEQAGHLHLEAPYGRDPNIDHLLQGCTYLAAQIHKRMDEEAEVLSEQLARQLWPQLLQPVPSLCVAQWTFKSLMASLQHIPVKTALCSVPVGDEQVSCRFETLTPFDIYPFTITHIELAPGRQTLTLCFESEEKRAIDFSQIRALPLFLADEYVHACELYAHLRRHCHRMSLVVGDEVFEGGLTVSFPVDRPEQGLQNPLETGWLAHQILFDYFSFHQKYLWIHLDGFQTVGKRASSGSFKVIFSFDQSFSAEYRVIRDSIKMNAGIVMNQFSLDCEPIGYDHTEYRYPVEADRQGGSAYRLLDIESVTGIDKKTGKITRYLPLSHVEDTGLPSFTVSREKRDDEREQLYLSCFSDNQTPEVVSVTARACNSFYPKRYIQRYGLYLSAPGLENTCTATNLSVPTKLLEPPECSISQSLIRYFTLSLNSLLDVDTLKHLLRALNWTGDPQHKRRIDGILKVGATLKSTVSRGAFFHTYHIALQLHDSHFVSDADIYFFGDILHAFFSAQAVMNQMVSMEVSTYPNEGIFLWEPILGKKRPV